MNKYRDENGKIFQINYPGWIAKGVEINTSSSNRGSEGGFVSLIQGWQSHGTLPTTNE